MREELVGLASRLKLVRAQLVSAVQRWNGLVEGAEFYGDLNGEWDGDRGGGDDDKDEGEGGGGGTISNGGRRSQGQGGGVQEELSFPFFFSIGPRRRWER